MKKYLQLVAAFLILSIFAISCSQKPKPAGNAEIFNEISRIEKLGVSGENESSNITPQDLTRLKELLKGDRIAEAYAYEFEWFARNNESQHILHLTYYLREYLKTGIDSPCIPHELWHLSLFVRHGDLVNAKLQLKAIEHDYDSWIKINEKKRKDYPEETYPRIYKSIGELERKSRESIEKLKQNDYSNKTLDELDKIGAAAIC